MNADGIDVVAEATKILKAPPLHVDQRRREAWWWCPFHNDAGRTGNTGKPNFSINMDTGEWNCFRCNNGGKTLYSLAKALGANWDPPENWKDTAAFQKQRAPSKVDCLNEALASARAAFLSSPALKYAEQRGLSSYTSAVYGLGYGQPKPTISTYSWKMANESRLLIKDTWLWAGSIVYADPLINPTVINCRYIPEEMLPEKTRWFEINDRHHTWGNRVVPLGSWRITAQTEVVMVVEGMFDMLVGAQTIASRGLHPEVVCVYTNGAKPASQIIEWFTQHAKQYYFVFVPDQDGAGLGEHRDIDLAGGGKEHRWIPGWKQALENAVKEGDGKYCFINTPDKMDPDEAFLGGWWPTI